MASTFIIVILVASGDGREVVAQSMVATARETLESSALVLLQEVRDPSEDAAALDAARTYHADAVAELTWEDPGRARARFRLRFGNTGAWSERHVTLDPRESGRERGRALGFTLAAMIPLHGEKPATAIEPAPPKEGPAMSPSTAPLPSPSPPAASPPPVRPASASPEAVAAFEGRLSVDAFAAVSTGLGDPTVLAGGGLDGALPFGRSLSARITAGGRMGTLPGTGIERTDWFFGGGVRATVARPTPSVWFDVRATISVMRLMATRTHEGLTSSEGRWLGGTEVGAELGWKMSSSLALIGHASLEAALGRTDVFVGDVHLATLIPLRLGTGLGLRIWFGKSQPDPPMSAVLIPQ